MHHQMSDCQSYPSHRSNQTLEYASLQHKFACMGMKPAKFLQGQLVSQLHLDQGVDADE